MSPTFRPQAAEIRAKVNIITPIKARPRCSTTKLRSSHPALPAQLRAMAAGFATARTRFRQSRPRGVLEHNLALSVKAPRQMLGKGKTPILTTEGAGDQLPRPVNHALVRTVPPEGVSQPYRSDVYRGVSRGLQGQQTMRDRRPVPWSDENSRDRSRPGCHQRTLEGGLLAGMGHRGREGP